MLLLSRGVEGNPFNYEKHIANSLLILRGRPEGLKREYAWDGMEGQCKAERRNTGFAEGLYFCSSISSSTYNPRFGFTKSEISGKKIGFMYEIGRADEVLKACYVFRNVLQLRPG